MTENVSSLAFNTVEEIEKAIDEFIEMQTEKYYVKELKKECPRMFDFKSFEEHAKKEELIEFVMKSDEKIEKVQKNMCKKH